MTAERYCFRCFRHRTAAGFVKPKGSSRECCATCNPERIVGTDDSGRPITRRDQLAKTAASNRRATKSYAKRGILAEKLVAAVKGAA